MFMLLTLSSLTSAFANISNDIGWKLYSSQIQEKNLTLSPASIHIALSLVFEGSTGLTRKKGFEFLGDNNLVSDLKHLKQVQIANSLWLNSDNKKLKEPSKIYLDKVQNEYLSVINRLSFIPAHTTAQTMNLWIEEKTNHLIKDMITPHDLEKKDMALINAIYFKGDWLNEFKPENTKADDFHADQKKVSAQFMAQRAQFNYAENDDVQMIELPYVGDEITMTILLPKKNSLRQWQQKFSTAYLSDLLKVAKYESTNLSLPKFKIEGKTIDLTLGLVRIGMPQVGDFSPLGFNPMSIDAVLHKVFVKVDEKGTEAAAATVVLMRAGSAMVKEKPKVFKADKPFLFVIREKKNGNWLFIGRVDEPEHENFEIKAK